MYSSSLPPAAKLTVVALGDYMDWTSGRGVHGRPGMDRLSEDFGLQTKPDTLRKHLSDAASLGLLVVTSDPSPGRRGEPGRPCVYAAAVPTGAVAPPAAATLPIDVPARRETGPRAGQPLPDHRHVRAGDSSDHRHPGALKLGDHRHVDAAYQRQPDQKTQDPPTPQDRPLLALVPGEGGNTGGGRSTRGGHDAAASPQAFVVSPELVASGLVAQLEQSMPVRFARRYERTVLVEVARLMQAGWRIDDLIEHAVEPSWSGVRDPGAVLLKRLRELPAMPPASSSYDEPVKPPRCGECDVNRQVELEDGRMRRCRRCHPLEVAAAPF